MELVVGETLREALWKHGPLPPTAALAVMEQLADTVAARRDHHLEDVDHAGVADPPHRLGLVHEPLDDAGRARELGQEHLDRDLAADVGVLGGVDPRHAALAERTQHAVAPDHLPDHGRYRSDGCARSASARSASRARSISSTACDSALDTTCTASV